MKRMALLSIPLMGLLLLTACSNGGSTQQPQANVQEQQTSSAPLAAVAKARVIDMTVGNFQFSPSSIIVKKGESIIVRLKNISGEHSFYSEALNLDVPVAEGQSVDITIPTQTAGTFDFRCGIPCGEGHREMTGQIVVQ
jgi:heme/copper-type cytochrome/quinol oxidase subunit 2